MANPSPGAQRSRAKVRPQSDVARGSDARGGLYDRFEAGRQRIRGAVDPTWPATAQTAKIARQLCMGQAAARNLTPA
jgi:hypothetical protein